MSATRTGGHDPRCEQSKAPNQRCRCECGGRLHGIRVVRERLGFEEAEETEQ